MSQFHLFKTGAVLIAALFSVWCCAHEGPEHEIEELTEQMKVQGETADLLLQRAIEYKVLGEFAKAARDLERAIELEDDLVTAQRELSQAYFSLGKTNEALATVTRALKSGGDAAEQAGLLVTRAGILRARREYSRALADVNDAVRKHPANAEWYLIRSQLQAILRLHPERVKGLEEGLKETGSGLLLGEHVDALIDNKQYSAALEIIDKELALSRWKASWLIRRGKVRLAAGKVADGKQDLERAIDELNRRLGSSAGDALLLADRATAYDLLGQKDDARRDYRSAREKGLADEWIRERIRVLREARDDD